LVALLAYALLAPDQLAPRPQPGDPAPEFTLNTFDSSQIALQDLRGQVVVLYFWASWAAPCRREAPGLEELWQSYKDRGVKLIGIPFQDAENASLDFLREFGITYPNGADPIGRIRSAYGVTQVPELFIVDPDGQVVWTRAGEFSADELKEQLVQLVGGDSETLAIQTAVPCLLLLEQTGDGITLSVSDPTQLRQQVQIRLTGHYTGTNAAYLFDQDTTVVTVELPTDDFAGQTVQIRLDKV
jgi:cytochrome c biogenesis protein CcmG/thiol:disulfide interchange protein DsbE